MKIKLWSKSAGLGALAVACGLSQGIAQTPAGPITSGPSIPDYGLANYANSPLPTVTGISGITVLNGGVGYTAPVVTLTTNGVQADTATATVSNGSITAITPANPNAAYASIPSVNISDATGLGASAAAIPTVTPGTGLRKFVDALPGLTSAGANGNGQYLPLGHPMAGSTPAGVPRDGDYYEIALVDYTERLHSDLPGVSHLRGYVQIEPPSANTQPVDSKHVALTNYDGSAVTFHGVPVYGYDNPHYLGPVIVAQRNVPVRVKFYNLLRTGQAGHLLLPVDVTVMGAGPYNIDWDPNDQTNHALLPAPITGNFAEDRASLHLHGGNTPWISDGTPHQWITPNGETEGAPYLRGVSQRNVPDMPVPEDGAETLYWSNEQGGRLMFYHDHAYGTTRLNVYAGEAAGYLLVDPAEENALAAAGVPGTLGNAGDLAHLLPLVIQDKAFVWGDTNQVQNPSGNAADGTYAVDPLWANAVPNSQPGDLWFPHIYIPNQNPSDPTGANALGRWDYGPWFWPPQLGAVAPMPLHSLVPEAFVDTPIVNGTAYPYANVQPTKYRLRILNACNDRMLNLQFYQADPANAGVPVGPNGLTEVAMVPATPNPAIPFPDVWKTQTPGMTPDILDSRPGGVPDPRLRGPALLQIASEGGLLPSPALRTNTPVGYEQNKRNIVVLNVAEKTLFMAPAERADVIVDFSQFAGKTVILYNDSPAPVPGADPRNDYYTGDLDNSLTAGANNQGGAPSTLPGYGPNIRTIMQFRVAASGSVSGIQVANAGTGYAANPTVLITPANGDTTGNGAAAIAMVDPNAGTVTNITLTSAGTGYTAPPIITINPAAGDTGSLAQATATLSINSTATPDAYDTNLLAALQTALPAAFAASQPAPIVPEATYPQTSYSAVSYPTTNTYSKIADTSLTVTDVNGVTRNIPMQPKCIQELFDPYGRMNAGLGVELPFTSFATQTTIQYEYIDPATETIPAGQIQIWKITHNGVDTHAIHFHLVNVQLINRVGWDGMVRPPDNNELGWKETIRMHPLEDCIVAVQAKPMTLPFALPNSTRPLDVTKPLGVTTGIGATSTSLFTGVDPTSGNPVTVLNNLTDFGWEYVWHCHLLGHEENDMMRPLIMQVTNGFAYVDNAYLPSVVASVTPAPNAAGWNNTPATVNIVATPGGPMGAAGIPLGAPIATVSYSSGAVANIPQSTVNGSSATLAITNEGTTTVSYSTTDSAVSAHATAGAPLTLSIDTTAPSTTAAATPAPNGAAWNNTPVNVTLSATDAGSGVSATYYTIDGVQSTYTAPFTVDGDLKHTVTYWSVDVAGNTETAHSLKINIDKTNPTLTWSKTPSLVPAAGVVVNGVTWYKSVSLPYSTADNLSGVASALPASPVSLPQGPGQVATVVVTDVAGNSASYSSSPAYNVDGTAPTLTVAAIPAANAAGWNSANVTGITLAGLDTGGSGLATLTYTVTVVGRGGNTTGNANAALSAHPQSYTTPIITLPGNGGNGFTANGTYTVNVAYTVTDAVGNSSSGTATLTVRIDKNAPTVTSAQSPAATGGWNRTTPVNVTLTGADTGGSGLATFNITNNGVVSIVAAPATAPFTTVIPLTSDGVQVLTFSTTDNAGNYSATGTRTVKIDSTLPTITATAPPTPASGWYAAPVTVTLTANDLGSGVASITYSAAGGQTIGNTTVNNPTPGSTAQTVNVTISTSSATATTITYHTTDVAGNVSANKTITVSVDSAAPTVTVGQTPAANAAGWNNANVAVTLTATDTASGVASLTYSINGGAVTPYTTSIVLSTEGTTVISYTATDHAGNVTTGAKTVKIDKTAPVAVVGAISGTLTGGRLSAVTVPVTVTETGSGISTTTVRVQSTGGFSTTVSATLTSGVLSNVNVPINPTRTSPGNYTITVTSTDVAGNATTVTRTGVSL